MNPIADCKPPAATVQLHATVAANGTIRIAWPAAAEGFTLEENGDLGVRDGWKAVADRLSDAAAKVKPLGMRTGYHNHQTEFVPLEGKRPTGWTADRDPFYLETSVPGIFVAGDVRHRSAKGVTSGVGEGAMAVKLVHQYLGLL